MTDTGKKKLSLWTTLQKEWYLLLLIAATFAYGLYVYPQLPAKVPSHWNIHGQVDGWSSKAFAVWFYPLLNLVTYPLFLLLPRIDPRRENYARFAGVYKTFRLILHVFFALLYMFVLLAGQGYPLQVDIFVKLLVSILFLLLGNYMGKIHHNYFMGIRTPWTLANEEVWRKTHRMAAPLWVGGGTFGILLSFFRSAWAGYLFFATLIAVALVPAVYSYFIYNKIVYNK